MILNNSLEATHDIAASIGEINKASPKIVQEKSQKKKKKAKGEEGEGTFKFLRVVESSRFAIVVGSRNGRNKDGGGRRRRRSANQGRRGVVAHGLLAKKKTKKPLRYQPLIRA